jgi:DNA-binding MarR family transcriptional regulator
MLAAAAVIETYKIISVRVEDVLGKIDDLTMSRYEILGLLDRSEEGRLQIRALKRATYLHPPTLTYTLDWLEGRSLVKREPSKSDRRSVEVGITRKGRALFERAGHALSKIHFGLQGVDASDALAVTKVLARALSD